MLCDVNSPLIDRERSLLISIDIAACDPIGKYRVQTHYGPVAPGHIYRINTGAPLPPGADAVIMVEDTVVISRLSSSIGADDATGEEDEVDVLAQVDVGENVRNPGSDVKSGDQVLEAGDVISGVGGELGKPGTSFPTSSD
jgi:gephyrin